MTIHTLQSIGELKKKPRKPTRGRRLGDLIAAKPALPAKKSKAGERSRESAPVPATRPERIEDDDDDDFDDNDDDGTGAYKPTPPGEDSDSDASGHMSVDPEEQQVEEEVAADGTLVVKKCAEKDYTKIEKEVVGSAEFAETGKYNTARFLALTAEQEANGEAEKDRNDIPTIDCDVQDDDDDIDAHFALPQPAHMTKEQFLASLRAPGYYYQEGTHLYEPEYTITTYSDPVMNSKGKIQWVNRTKKTMRVFDDGSVPLRRIGEAQDLAEQWLRPNNKAQELTGKEAPRTNVKNETAE